MRKLLALAATAALAVGALGGSAVASHKSQSKHGPPPDCAIEIDPLGVCLG